MNKEAILHIPESNYCFAADEKTAVLRLRTARTDDFDEIRVVYGNKYAFAAKRHTAVLSKKHTDGLYDYYTARLALSDVRLVYVFVLSAEGRTYYFSEDGLSDTFDFNLAYFNAFQLPYINSVDVHREVTWMREAVFYQIFIDRFLMGDREKDTRYINLKWGETPNPASFAGGDLKGIISKLGYLAGLGINVLYLTPVFRSVSNHKYDISDYYNIDPQFGSNEDFRRLVDSAHERGIRIVLDAVFNHASERLREFQDVIEKGRASQYHGWFLIDGDKPEKSPLNYECFSICDYMPKFNTSNDGVQRFLLDIAAYWTREYGIDGWRLDVSDEVSHDFWRAFRKEVKSINPECVIIGENWHDANPFLKGDQYDGIMNYAFTKACYDFFVTGKADAAGFSERLNGLLMRNTDQVNSMMLNILDSHDTHRFLTQVRGNKDKLLCALAAAFMYTGAPGLYYGTEIGMSGGYDPDCRRTFDWTAAGKDTEISRTLKGLIALKKRAELVSGDIKIYAGNGLFFVERAPGGGMLKLTVNNAPEPRAVSAKKPELSHNYSDGILKPGGFIVESVR